MVLEIQANWVHPGPNDERRCDLTTATVIDQTLVTMEVVKEGLRLENKSNRIHIICV
jgi:hypothetical protein